MSLIVVDTETAGLPIRGSPSEDPSQPFVVSIALISLDHESLAELEAQHFILKPPAGRTIPEEVTKIHGISTERANDEGVDPADVVRLYSRMRRSSHGSIAHNAPFDVRMMRIEMLRYGATKEHCDTVEAASPQHCTQKLATPILRLPPTAKMVKAGFNKPKAASLADGLRLMFNEVDPEAHGALADARNCARVFRWLRDNGHV